MPGTAAAAARRLAAAAAHLQAAAASGDGSLVVDPGYLPVNTVEGWEAPAQPASPLPAAEAGIDFSRSFITFEIDLAA
eukprot:SAG22_NODE_94_length_20824_cov_230.693718_18_plen_78_part_00